MLSGQSIKGWLYGASIAFSLAAALWATPVFADTGGYPYADTPCVWAPYAVQSTVSNWCADYDWGYTHDDLSASNVISPYGYYYRNCTDYTAWRVSALGVGAEQYQGLGNAKDWVVRARLKGLPVDDMPAVGSVAVRTTGPYGHTAFVEEVNPAGYPAGSIRVSQYNYRGDGNYSQQIGTPTSLGFLAFVHFEMYMAAQAVVSVAEAPAAEPIVVADETQAEAIPVAEDVAVAPEPQPQVVSVVAAQDEPAPAEESAVSGLLPDEIVEAPPAEQPAQSQLPVQAVEEPEPEATEPAHFALMSPASAIISHTPLPQMQLRQASGPPPMVQPATLVQYKKAASSNPSRAVAARASFDYWPLMGLVGVVLVREAALKRLR